MNYSTLLLTMAVLCWGCDSNSNSEKSSAKPVADSAQNHEKKQSTVTIKIIGKERDIVEFSRDGKIIGTDGGMRPEFRPLDIPFKTFDNVWRNGNWNTGCSFSPCTDLDVKKAFHEDVYYFSVRHGELRDAVFYYAVVGDKVYRSKEWNDSDAGNTSNGVAIDHEGAKLIVKGFPFSEANGVDGVPYSESSYGYITFNKLTTTFTYESNKSSFSTNPSRLEKVLSINGN